MRLPSVKRLLEDMGNLLANVMYADTGGPAGDAADIVIRDMEELYAGCRDLVIVSNDVFSGGVCYDEDTVEYMKKLARINREFAKRADLVAEVVCGLADVLKEPG